MEDVPEPRERGELQGMIVTVEAKQIDRLDEPTRPE